MKISNIVFNGLFAALVLSVSLASPVARAGGDAGAPSRGFFYSDGSGYCAGTMNGFRASSDATAQFILQDYADTTGSSRYIVCQLNGSFHFVGLSQSNAAVWALFTEAAAAPQTMNIFVHWNTSGVVDSMQLYNASYFH